MKFYDLDSEKIITLLDIKKDYETYKQIEPWNYEKDFLSEMYVILMDTVNGRNNIEIMSLTGKETSEIIIKLGKKVVKNDN